MKDANLKYFATSLKQSLILQRCTNNDMIIKIRFTVHTAGIYSFSMYRHLTQPVDGIPKANRTRFQSLSFILTYLNLLRKNLYQAKSGKLNDVKVHRLFSCFPTIPFLPLDLDQLLILNQHLPPHHQPKHRLLTLN